MTAADLERVDVPLPELIRQIDKVTAMKRAHMVTALLSEERHQCDPVDARFAGLVCGCKTPLATDEDYPGFAAWITQQEALNEKARRAS